MSGLTTPIRLPAGPPRPGAPDPGQGAGSGAPLDIAPGLARDPEDGAPADVARGGSASTPADLPAGPEFDSCAAPGPTPAPETAADGAPNLEPPASEVVRDYAFDDLLEGLASGRYGGAPARGGAAAALVECLRRVGWAPDPRAFNDALPHMAAHFGISELRATLLRLGYRTRAVEPSGRMLGLLPPGALILNRSGRPSLLEPGDDGAPLLREPGDPVAQPVRLRRTYRAFVVEETEDPAAPGRDARGVAARLLHRFGPEIRLLAFLSLLSGALVLLASKSVALIFDAALPARAGDTLAGIVAGVAALVALDLAFRRLKAGLLARVAARLEYVLSVELFEKLLGLPMEKLAPAPVSEQIGRLKQFVSLRDLVGGPLAAVALELPLTLALLAVVTALSPAIGAAALISVAIHVAIGLAALPAVRAASGRLAGARAGHSRLFAETLAQADQVIRRGLGPALAARLHPAHERVAEAQFALDGIFRRLQAAAAALGALTVSAIVFVGAWEAMQGRISSGVLIACTLLGARLLAPVQQGLLLAARLPDTLRVLRQIDAMMAIPGIEPGAPGGGAPARIGAAEVEPLRVDGAVLRYPGTAAPALRGISIAVEPGTLVCLTGPSGAGKSSLLRVVAGLWRLQAGAVYLGELNLAQLDPAPRAAMIGHLGHHPGALHGTVAQNLRLGAPGAPDAALWAAVEELGLASAIRTLPEGMETRLTHTVQATLTPGFRAKLALAQLLLRDPPVLLLDEPEGGLSPEDEGRLLAAIERRRGRSTVILVTHRPSLIRRSDLVLALQAGRLRFAGPPDKLNFEMPK